MIRRPPAGALPADGRPRLLEAVAGNSMALFVGFLTCYVMMVHAGVSLRQWDFLYYFSGSKLVLQGHGGSLYDLHVISRVESALAYPWTVRGGGLPYVYPPFLAVALAPLAALPYDVAYLVWLGFDCVLLALSLALLERYAGISGRRALWFRLATACSLPVILAFMQGQTSLALLAALVLALFALRADHPRLAGCLVAVLLIKPPYVLPFLLVLVARREWKALLSFLGAAAALTLLPLAVLGIGTGGAYAHTMLQAATWRSGQVGGFDPASTRSFAGLAGLLLPGAASGVATVGFGALCLAILALCSLKAREIDLPWGLATVCAVLASPHVLIHDLALLLLPVAVAFHYREAGPSRLTVLIVAGYLCVLVGFRLSYSEPIQLSVPAMAALGCWLVLAARREVGRSARVPTHEARPDPSPA